MHDAQSTVNNLGTLLDRPGKRTSRQPGLLRELRALVPRRPDVTYAEALILAELQAAKLWELCAVDEGPVPSEVVTELPRLRVERTLGSTSGASLWDQGDGEWVIYLNRFDSWRRQRFTLFHEFKHIIDHGRRHVLYAGPGHHDPGVEAERAADYFAGCVLVPKKFLKRAWGEGIQKVADLAGLFGVSEVAIEVRLRQTGLRDCDHREETGVVRHAIGWQAQCQGRRAGGTWWPDLSPLDFVRSLQ
ncbi:ImmA/IrrE family metallo-endopeptidase [Nocardia sp. NPDC004068]|uniref:ImmA/IrrE family metallo-endopeptidase n=1 Tax=Nocardia sp. NPDC004068 TaxID=3364303 RepID=UPI0036CB20A1